MNKANLLKIAAKGEGISVEFKKSQNNLNRDVYDTICAFSNRIGGNLFLGIDDNGNISGIEHDKIESIKQDLVTSLNNPQKINPPLYLIPEQYEHKGKLFLYLNVPESSQVHKHNNKIFDRNEDGDFDITNNTALVSNMYLRKQTSYSENKIYPFVTMDDLRIDLIHRARILAENQRPGHIWNELTDFEMLKSAQLFHKDYQTGEKGFTLAGILLFGKDETILSVLPHHKTDAILRQKNLGRYDDRDIIQTNLIESYDRLKSFIAKHLPDKFYLDGDQRISLRDHIFREVISNILIHREFVNPYPARLVIGIDSVITENANKPHGFGKIDFNNFSPYPKNPVIARVFREIGRADELGSGIKNLKKYCREYSGEPAQLIEKDVFKTVIKLPYDMEINEGLYKELNEGLKTLLIEINNNEGIQTKDLSIRLKDRSIKTIERQLRKLKEMNLIERQGSKKTGGYYPVNSQPQSEGLNEELNGGLNEGLKTLLIEIKKNEGIQAKDLSIHLNNRPIKTIERQIKELKNMKLIERRGSKKTGGYYLIQKSDGEINE